jgi:hypothetical protein
MPLIPISCLLADRLFPAPAPGCAAELPIVSPDAALTLSVGWGLPRSEMEFDVLPFVDYAWPSASDGGMLVGFVWCEGVRYEISC